MYAYSLCRRDDPEVKKLFTAIDKRQIKFGSVPRPVLQIEIKEQTEKKKRSCSLKVFASQSHSRSDSSAMTQLRTRLYLEFRLDFRATHVRAGIQGQRHQWVGVRVVMVCDPNFLYNLLEP